MRIRLWATLGAALIAAVAYLPVASAGVVVRAAPRPFFRGIHGCHGGAFCHHRLIRRSPAFRFGAGFRERELGAEANAGDISSDFAGDDDLAPDHQLWFRVQEKFGPGDLGRPPIPEQSGPWDTGGAEPEDGDAPDTR